MENSKMNEYEIRKNKLKNMKEVAIAFKDKYEVKNELCDAKTMEDGEHAKVAGRVVSKRVFGKLMFLDLQAKYRYWRFYWS